MNRDFDEIEILDRIVDRIAIDDDERRVLRRQLGVDRLEENMRLNYAPVMPAPTPPDPFEVATDAAVRYRKWIDAAATDDDPTPLKVRERALAEAEAAIERLRPADDQEESR